jgi:hypothetical protein
MLIIFYEKQTVWQILCSSFDGVNLWPYRKLATSLAGNIVKKAENCD